MSPENAAAWQSARTLADLGELTAQWIEGTLASQPGYFGRSDIDRSDVLVPLLAAVNRAGFRTDCSQAAEAPCAGYDDRVWEQRAGVTGLADDQAVARLRAAIAGTRLILTARRGRDVQGVSYRDAIPVTCADEKPVTWFGAACGPDELADTLSPCHPDTIGAACDAWQVAVIDPEWGRNDVLWPALERFAAPASRAGDDGHGIFQVVVRPGMDGPLRAWLAGRGQMLARMPDGEDGLPAFVISPAQTP
jgi:hypothetical protein